jgi:PAS domain S-box-containing protein
MNSEDKKFSLSKGKYKIWVLIWAAILISSFSFGQTKEIDSLQSLLATANTPIQKITILNELTNILQFSDDSVKLSQYLDDVIRLSKNYKYLKGLKYVYSTLGSIHFNKANLTEAEKYYKLSENIAGRDLEAVIIRNNNLYAELYSEQGRFSEALELIKASLKLGKGLAIMDLARTHAIASSIYQGQSENEKSRTHLLAARAIIKGSKNFTMKFQVYKQIFKYFRNATDLDSLALFGNQLDELSKKLVFNYWKAQSNEVQAFLSYEKGENGNAVKFTLRALAVIEPRLFKYQYVNLLYKAGSFYHGLWVHDKARDYMIKAQKIAENKKLLITTLYINNSLAFQFYRTSNLKKSYDFAEKTLSLAKKINLKEIKCNIYGLLSQIYLAQGNVEKAIMEGDSSIEAAKQAADVIGEAYAYQTQVPNYLTSKQYDKAIEFADKAVSLFTKIGDNSNSISEAYLNLAEAYIGKKDLNKAHHFLTKASKITANSELFSMKLGSAIIGVMYYEAKGDYKNAFKNQQLVTQLSDSIDHQTANERLQNLQMLYDVEKQEQQLEIFREQEASQKAYSALQKSKLEKDNIVIVVSCASVLILLLVAILLYNNSEKKEKTNEELKALNLEIINQNQEINASLLRIGELNEEIENREKQYKRIVENAEDIICEINEKGFFTYSNPAGLKLLGYSMQELKKVNFLALLDNSISNSALSILGDNLKKGVKNFYVEAPILTKSGGQLWIGINVIRHSVSQEPVGAEVFARNITERKKAELYIKSINARLENLIQAIQAGILLENEQGEVALANKAFCEIFKIPLKPDQLIGFNCKEAAKGASKLFEKSDTFISDIEQIERNRRIVVNDELKMLDGNILWRDYVPIVTDGKFYGQMWIYRNVSSQKQMEYDLKIAKEEAELANEAKSQFLANISHELRTPLNAIIGFSDLLQKSKLENSQLKFTNIIIDSSELLLKIIEDILDFSKIESGRLQLFTEPTNLRSLGENALNVIRPKAQEKKISLSFIFQSLPEEVIVDQTRLQQILLNLLSNSLKFTESGKIELGIMLKGKLDNKLSILFYVEDTGIGIAPENQEKIFEAFVQEDISTTKKFGGTGLGLTISNNLIKLMGGKLELVSYLGRGSKFYFTLLLDENGS